MSLLIDPYRFAASGGGGGYSAEVLADSPLAYWRLGETSGATAADSSGNGRDATYTNSPTLGVTGLLAGDTNKAMQVAVNTGQCVSVASAAWMNVSELTVECLANLTSGTATDQGDGIFSRYTSAGGFPWMLWRNTSGKWAVQFRNAAGTAYNVASAATVTVSQTYHLAFTVSASTLTLYVDGASVGSASIGAGGIQSSTSPIEVARYSQTNSTTPGGVIDEATIYGTALSATRIAAHAAAA